MALIIGIDTGGTYTDAVIYDNQTRQVLARGKSPTTHEELSVGIGKALDTLPTQLLKSARAVALSTTLATNACVEGKGCRARLLMMGTNRKTLEWVEADKKYGLDFDAVLCIPEHGGSDGSRIDQPDWDRIVSENDGFFRQAEALSVVELNAMQNGGTYENEAVDVLRKSYGFPLVKANDLVRGLNIMERGATALLNARLLPVVDRFVDAVGEAIKTRGLDIPRVIIRSDGSQMAEIFALDRPVETILSGPAASVSGCRALTRAENALIIDMGGTTTDISILRGGSAQMSEGINIGGWRTQIQGVYIDTIALGGDTRIWLSERHTALDKRRVEPICVAASRWPKIKDDLKELVESRRMHSLPLHEFLYLVRRPEDLERYTESELKIINALEDGPKIIGGGALDMYKTDSARLETEGVVMRVGLTPTDIMHIRGDFGAFDGEASRLAVRYFLQILPEFEDCPEHVDVFCDTVYDLVKKKLFENIARVFLDATYPKIFGRGPDEQIKAFISNAWEKRGKGGENDFFSLRLDPKAALVGVGAPIHLFLPDVAKALGVECVIPEDSAVANAVGAAAAEIEVKVTVEIRGGMDIQGAYSYTVHSQDSVQKFEKESEALEAAKIEAERLVSIEVLRRGAGGNIRINVRTERHLASDRVGNAVDLGTTVVGTASGTPAFLYNFKEE